MKEKKYILTDETKSYMFTTLRRIVALRDFGYVKKGDKGGWVESEENLSHEDDCWIYDEATVSNEARVSDNASVHDNAFVFGSAKIYDNACIRNKAVISGNAEIYGDARVYENADVYGDARVYENADVYGNAEVYGSAKIHGAVDVYGEAEILDADVAKIRDYITFKNSFSSGRYFTYTMSNKMWKVGCFYGTGEELIEKAKQDYPRKAKCYKVYVDLVEKLEKLYH